MVHRLRVFILSHTRLSDSSLCTYLNEMKLLAQNKPNIGNLMTAAGFEPKHTENAPLRHVFIAKLNHLVSLAKWLSALLRTDRL